MVVHKTDTDRSEDNYLPSLMHVQMYTCTFPIAYAVADLEGVPKNPLFGSVTELQQKFIEV